MFLGFHSSGFPVPSAGLCSVFSTSLWHLYLTRKAVNLPNMTYELAFGVEDTTTADRGSKNHNRLPAISEINKVRWLVLCESHHDKVISVLVTGSSRRGV
ncbi:hypothetical protein PoB_006965100 [Plakobranchus ocellatus]|uniref:Uncharacterized protein n=1 Tax=Plakobranchus ocellatus TaxID=259542 RepID=A0AAV4DG48_9GAST|nr:hypothetical protein PoB_006965100 [Plakobranchus ocellatus]